MQNSQEKADVEFHHSLQSKSQALREHLQLLNSEIEILKKDIRTIAANQNTGAQNLAAAIQESDNWQKFKNVISDNKKMILKDKLERMNERRKFKILKPVQENAEAKISNRAVKEVHKRCHDDLQYMTGGPKARLFRFRRHH